MPAACQLIKPLCYVAALERHLGAGMSLSPPTPPPPAPPAPCAVPVMWATAGLTYMGPQGDPKSTTVEGDNCSLIKRGSDNKFLRPHICCGGTVPPCVVTPVTDLGLIALHIAFGSSKTVWGPFSVKANISSPAGDSVGVIMLAPGRCMGIANHHVCSLPTRIPSLTTLQNPNSVFAGMTAGDIVGCLILYGIAVLIGLAATRFFRIGRVQALLGRMVSAVSSRLIPAISRALGPRIGAQRALLALTAAYGNADNPAATVLDDVVENVITNSINDLAENGIGIPVYSAVGGGGPRATRGWSSLQGGAGQWTANLIDG